jgi:hypothetical protein
MALDINNPEDGNKFGDANPHTEPVPSVVDNAVQVEESSEEPKKVAKKSSKK